MSAVERAAEVICADLRWHGLYSAEEAGRDIAQALANAGLLVTDSDRAVLDAAKELHRVWVETEDSRVAATDALADAVDRREAQP